MFEVCIRLDDQGQYSVGAEPNESGEMEGMTQQQQTSKPGMMDMMQEGGNMEEDKNMTPAKNLDDALQQARRLLMEKSSSVTGGAFDQGLSRVLPKRQGMM
ncbi:MAG: hypothetical protein WC856_07795 [Methylococcaceae bacterium]|jgi:hypothetical protein